MAWTYILECADGSFYVGSTVDLEQRVAQHQAGEGAAYTRRRRPVQLVWCPEFQRIDDAFRFEKQVQGWGRPKRQALIDGDVHLLSDLASRSWASRQQADEPQPERAPLPPIETLSRHPSPDQPDDDDPWAPAEWVS